MTVKGKSPFEPTPDTLPPQTPSQQEIPLKPLDSAPHDRPDMSTLKGRVKPSSFDVIINFVKDFAVFKFFSNLFGMNEKDQIATQLETENKEFENQELLEAKRNIMNDLKPFIEELALERVRDADNNGELEGSHMRYQLKVEDYEINMRTEVNDMVSDAENKEQLDAIKGKYLAKIQDRMNFKKELKKFIQNVVEERIQKEGIDSDAARDQLDYEFIEQAKFIDKMGMTEESFDKYKTQIRQKYKLT